MGIEKYQKMEEYAKACDEIIRRHDGDIIKSCLEITNLNFDGELHPMLQIAETDAWEVAHCVDFPSVDENWIQIKEAVRDFLNGDYWTTTMFLWAAYEYAGEDSTELNGFSVRIFRSNGATTIEAAGIKELYRTLQDITDSINQEQTDERYLQNLMAKLPQRWGGYRLGKCDICEEAQRSGR